MNCTRPAALLFVACVSAGSALVWAADQAPPNAAELSKRATERARAVKLPEIKPVQLSDAQKKAVETASDSARNAAKSELTRLAQEHPFTPAPANANTTLSNNPAVAKSDLPAVAGRVVIALSSSMPETEWTEYMAQLDGKPEALVVLRGFIGGGKTVAPTGKFIERITRVNQSNPKGKHRGVNIVVDPLLYRSLGIDKVPAVVWLPGVTEVSHCDEKDFQAAVTVYGTTKVSYALKQINRSGGDVPDELIQKFGG